MNSAPVQILPIYSGSGYKQNISNMGTAAESNRKFDDVFETAVAETESKPVENVPVDESRKMRSGKEKPEVSSSEPVQRKKTGKDEDYRNDDAAAVKAADSAEKPKNSKSAENEKHRVESGKTADDKSPKINLKAVKKETAAQIVKDGTGVRVSAEAGINEHKPGVEKQKSLIEMVKAFSGSESGKSVLAEKLAAAAAGLKQSGDKTVHEKPSVKIINFDPGKLKNSPENEKSAGAADKKNVDKAEKKQDRFRITDHRKMVSSETEKTAKFSVPNDTAESKNTADHLTKELNHVNASGQSRELSGHSEAKSMKSAVLSQLRESVNNQIVKQAGIVVKGNGTGEIKLVMKPESLGKVRIQLSLNDNHIAGRIIVENNIVREIFESNLENLYKAFGTGGFENGGIEVSVQGQGNDSAGGNRKDGKALNGRAVKAMEEAVPLVTESEWQSNAVNMVV